MALGRTRAALFTLFAASGASALYACGTSSFQGSESDASSADASPGSDANADRDARAGNDAGPRFCSVQSPVPFLCADFEDDDIRYAFMGTTDSIFFDYPTSADDGGVALSADGENGSRGLHTFLPPVSGGAPAAAYLAGKVTLASSALVTLTTDIRFDAVGDVSSSNRLTLVAFELDNETTKSHFDLEIYSSRMHLEIQQNGVSEGTLDLGLPPAPSAAWVPFRVQVRPGPVGSLSDLGTVEATFGSVTQSTQGYVDVSQQSAAFSLGPRSTGTNPNITLHFDDATLDVGAPDAGLSTGDAG